MNNDFDLSSLTDVIRERLIPRLPIIMIALALVGNGFYVSMSILPDWFIYNDASERRGQLQEQLEVIQAEQASSPDIVRSQIERIETNIAEGMTLFLNSIQPDEVMNNLYVNAQTADVSITRIQVLSGDETLQGQPYDQHVFQLEIVGRTVQQLLNFIILTKETSLPAVTIEDLHLVERENGFMLSMALYMFTAPDVTSIDFALLETYPLLPVPTVEDEVVVEFVAPEATVPPPVIELAPEDNSETETMVNAMGTPMAADNMTPDAPVVICEGALDSLLEVGDAAVVSLDGGGALRLLLDARGGASSASMQIYDDSTISILSGPICGSWQGQNVLYWYVDYGGNRGWVGEGVQGSRWLCPVANPNCNLSLGE